MTDRETSLNIVITFAITFGDASTKQATHFRFQIVYFTFKDNLVL